MDKGLSAVTTTAQYSRKTAGKLVGEERLQPVDTLATQTFDTLTAAADCVRTRGVVGAVRSGTDTAKTAATGAVTSARDKAHALFESLVAAVHSRVKVLDEAVVSTAKQLKAKAADAQALLWARVVTPTSAPPSWPPLCVPLPPSVASASPPLLYCLGHTSRGERDSMLGGHGA